MSSTVHVVLNGVYFTIEAALPALLEHGEGGAIVITSSTAGLNSPVSDLRDSEAMELPGYQAAKHGVVGLMRYYATSLAEKHIRVNTVHPTGVATPMIVNPPKWKSSSQSIPKPWVSLENPLHVQLLDSVDISEAMIYLCGRRGPLHHRCHIACRRRAGCQKVTVS